MSQQKKKTDDLKFIRKDVVKTLDEAFKDLQSNSNAKAFHDRLEEIDVKNYRLFYADKQECRAALESFGEQLILKLQAAQSKELRLTGIPDFKSYDLIRAVGQINRASLWRFMKNRKEILKNNIFAMGGIKGVSEEEHMKSFWIYLLNNCLDVFVREFQRCIQKSSIKGNTSNELNEYILRSKPKKVPDGMEVKPMMQEIKLRGLREHIRLYETVTTEDEGEDDSTTVTTQDQRIWVKPKQCENVRPSEKKYCFGNGVRNKPTYYYVPEDCLDNSEEKTPFKKAFTRTLAKSGNDSILKDDTFVYAEILHEDQDIDKLLAKFLLNKFATEFVHTPLFKEYFNKTKKEKGDVDQSKANFWDFIWEDRENDTLAIGDDFLSHATNYKFKEFYDYIDKGIGGKIERRLSVQCKFLYLWIDMEYKSVTEKSDKNWGPEGEMLVIISEYLKKHEAAKGTQAHEPWYEGSWLGRLKLHKHYEIYTRSAFQSGSFKIKMENEKPEKDPFLQFKFPKAWPSLVAGKFELLEFDAEALKRMHREKEPQTTSSGHTDTKEESQGDESSYFEKFSACLLKYHIRDLLDTHKNHMDERKKAIENFRGGHEKGRYAYRDQHYEEMAMFEKTQTLLSTMGVLFGSVYEDCLVVRDHLNTYKIGAKTKTVSVDVPVKSVILVKGVENDSSGNPKLIGTIIQQGKCRCPITILFTSTSSLNCISFILFPKLTVFGVGMEDGKAIELEKKERGEVLYFEYVVNNERVSSQSGGVSDYIEFRNFSDYAEKQAKYGFNHIPAHQQTFFFRITLKEYVLYNEFPRYITFLKSKFAIKSNTRFSNKRIKFSPHLVCHNYALQEFNSKRFYAEKTEYEYLHCVHELKCGCDLQLNKNIFRLDAEHDELREVEQLRRIAGIYTVMKFEAPSLDMKIDGLNDLKRYDFISP
eukprot:g152.t1